MLYSEMPDMSSLNQDFLQQQQQHQRRSPQPISGGERGSGEHAGSSSMVPGNGRTGMAPPPGNGRLGGMGQPPGMGNWNGNNHINNEPPPPPVGHMMQDSYTSNTEPEGSSHERPHPPLQRTTHLSDSRDSNNFCRGPLRTSNSSNSSNERLHPYQRPSGYYQGQQVIDPRFTSHLIRPGHVPRPPDSLTFDPRAAASRRR